MICNLFLFSYLPEATPWRKPLVNMAVQFDNYFKNLSICRVR